MNSQEFLDRLYNYFERYQRTKNPEASSAKIASLLYLDASPEQYEEFLSILFQFGLVLYKNSHYHFLILVFTLLIQFLQDKNKENQIVSENKENQMVCECHIYIGQANYRLGRYQEAIEEYNVCVKIQKGLNDLAGEARSYGNLGIAYDGLREYHKAIEYHNKSLNIARSIGNENIESKSYENLGVAHYALQDYHKAIEYHSKALEIAKKIGEKQVEANSYKNLGMTFYALHDHQKATEYNNKAFA